MDYYDLGAVYGTLAKALNRAKAKFLVISVSSDWLFPTSQSREIVRALRVNDKDVSFVELQSGAGHDAFLLEVDEITRLICGFLGMECGGK
jgi:homoserine O-acetyltransferase